MGPDGICEGVRCSFAIEGVPISSEDVVSKLADEIGREHRELAGERCGMRTSARHLFSRREDGWR